MNPSGKRQPKSRQYMQRNRPVHIPAGHFAVGQIVGVHGLRGELKVESHTDFPERFAPGETLLVGYDLQEIELLSVRPHKGKLLMCVAGIQDRSAAERLRGQWLFVREEDVKELDKDTYWVHDIVGLEVITEDGRKLGIIKEVLFTGANEVYVIAALSTVNRGRDILLPAIADVVQSVDIEKGIMVVRLMPGLMEE